MEKLIFTSLLIITIGVFIYSISIIIENFKLTRSAYPIKRIGKRIKLIFVNGFFQKKIFRNRIAGIMHALVFWGFCIILFGSLEIVVDGVFGLEKSFAILGNTYCFLMSFGDVFAYIIGICIIIFIIRRYCLNIARLHGKELSKKNHKDAYLALTFIFLLMLSLAGLNTFFMALHTDACVVNYPISKYIASLFSNLSTPKLIFWYKFNWWTHILLIFIFANILPYSKHFHIFLSLPNVFLSRLSPLSKLYTMEQITKEAQIILNPELFINIDAISQTEKIERFGILDVENITWKNYIDSLACTQCGRCTAVCPANITGKALSPRKLFMDIRKRMNEKSKGLKKEGKTYNDNKSLIRDYVTEEEIWACVTCNACAKECPLNIDHPTFIIDLRRYLVMEKGNAPHQLNTIFANIENNGSPWQYSKEDRLKWTEQK